MRSPIDVESTVDIDAAPETVWRVLTDLPSFAAWNPFIVDARGDLRLGGSLRLRVPPFVFHARITVFDRPWELRWKGFFLDPWLAEGDHVFELSSRGPGRTRLVQRERFTGLLPRALRPILVFTARRGFERMHEALSAQCVREHRVPFHADGAPA